MSSLRVRQSSLSLLGDVDPQAATGLSRLGRRGRNVPGRRRTGTALLQLLPDILKLTHFLGQFGDFRPEGLDLSLLSLGLLGLGLQLGQFPFGLPQGCGLLGDLALDLGQSLLIAGQLLLERLSLLVQVRQFVVPVRQPLGRLGDPSENFFLLLLDLRRLLLGLLDLLLSRLLIAAKLLDLLVQLSDLLLDLLNLLLLRRSFLLKTRRPGLQFGDLLLKIIPFLLNALQLLRSRDEELPQPGQALGLLRHLA